MRHLHLLWIMLLACAAAAQQPEPGGLTPKAGAVSQNLYTNVFFGFNFRFPQDWDVSFVASEGPCVQECILLEVRAPGYPKLPRSISIGAEAGVGRTDHQASAAVTLERSGARKVASVRELQAGSRKFFRVDYRSQLLNSDLYQAFVVMPEKNYLVVFTFSAESRKQLDALADELTRNLSFVGPKSATD